MVPTDAPADAGDAADSLFYDRVLDYAVLALLGLGGLLGAWGGVTVLGVDRSFAEEVAADFAASPEYSLSLTEAELADAVATLLTWAGGGLLAAGVATIALAAWFFRYRDRVRDRLDGGDRPPRFHAPLLGGLLATALAFVPFAQVLAGGVAGWLSADGAVRDAALAGVLFAAPAYVLWVALVAGAVAAGVPSLAALFVGVAAVNVVVDVVLALVGGVVAALAS